MTTADVSARMHASPGLVGRLRVVLAWVAALGALYVVTAGVAAWLHDALRASEALPLAGDRRFEYTAAFAAFFVPVLYVVPCLLARRWLRPDLRTLALYSGVAFLFGAGLEVTLGPAFLAVVGRPCWVYHVWPVHGGNTSGVGLVMWPMYGMFVALLHQAIHQSAALRFLDGHGQRAALLAVDAMLLEVAANVFSLAGFGSWHFRYHAPDVSHFTTIEAFPIYLVGGYVGVRILHALEHHAARAWVGLAMGAVATVAVLWG